MTTLRQLSFAGGELAPSLYARTDQSKFGAGLRTCRNHMVMRHGGVTTRPGTGFVGEIGDSTKTVRLIPFVFNTDQTYILEFGNLYMRVHRDGAQVTETAKVITGVTQANPAVVTSAAHGFSNGDEVIISGILGMTELNGRQFKVYGVAANSFQLRYMDGTTTVNSTGFGAYASAGTASRVYQITTPYLEADLQDIGYVQSADVVTLVHPSYEPRELSRTAHTSWTLSTITFIPTQARPTACTGTPGAAGALTFRYRVTAINLETREESASGLEALKAITAITQANPAVVTSAGHGFSNGDQVFITGISGMTQLNNRHFVVAGAAANTFQLNDIDTTAINSTSYTAYTAGGTVGRASIVIPLAQTPTTANPIVLNWTAASGAVEYSIYKELDGVYGFIGVAGGTTFSDDGISADTTDTAPIPRNPFIDAGNYPSAVTYYQQRLGFGNTNNHPAKCFFSKTGAFKNFTSSSPIQDDDAVSFELAGKQVNKIRHMLDIQTLVVFTSAGELAIEGDSAGVLKPTAVNAKQQTYNGANSLPPIVIGGNALYVQARGSIVRDLGFEFQSDSYKGNDLTVFSAHLFDAYTIRDWTYQQVPNSIIWAARSDGKLLGLTYVREHQLWAWHRHDTDGLVEQVCSVPEGTEDALYMVVKRTIPGLSGIGGTTRRYVERMKTRRISDIEDSVFMDASLSLDGTHAGSTTMTLTGSGWLYTDTLTLTASAAFFTAADVGNAIHLIGSDGTTIRFTIDAFSSTTVVTGRPHKTVPASMQAVAISSWGKAVDTIGGLWHLEGEDVSVFGDAFVVASPNNDSYDVRTVANGQVVLDRPYQVLHAGMPYISDIETLDVDVATGETIADKKKLITKVSMFVEASRGIWIGPKPPTDDDVDPLENLFEIKIRDMEPLDEPVSLATEVVDVQIQGEWNSNGRVFVRQVDPIPLTILSVLPAGLVPIRG